MALQLRVSRKSAYQWHQLWRDGDVQTLASRGPSGSRCRLPPRCLEKLTAHLEQGPAAHGWVEDQMRTAARVTTLIGGVHQLVKAPIVLVRDRLNSHVSHAMCELIGQRAWLTVFLLPAHSPDLNPVERVRAHVKRGLADPRHQLPHCRSGGA
ncbi:transposase [Kitasatospora sp. NPDC051914]|uniref:transposase n=1 Tax=Kitasatospora sp. NPDC051914 TaxID=3154945 RepID=UPI003435C45A